MEFDLLWAAVTAALAVNLVLRWEAARGNAAADCAGRLWDWAVAAAVGGLLVGRVAAMVAAGVNPVINPADLIVVRGGVATGPAAAAALAGFSFAARRSPAVALAALAPAALAGLAGWQAGCLFRAACAGSPTGLPWGITAAGSSVARHPVELYAAGLFLAGALGLALWKQRGRPGPWTVIGVALMVAGAGRALTEPLRPTLGTGPIGWYLAAVVAGAALIALRHRLPQVSAPPE